ncbi:hypothetical protein TNCV_2016071 [Trichonephila clavipes]|nr:hypothetical protein TNCV_2016071 [Trichonephila clavipes]
MHEHYIVDSSPSVYERLPPPVEELVHVKSIKAQSPHFGAAWNECLLPSHYKETRGLFVTDPAILKHGQVKRKTPELAPPSPNFNTSPIGGL